MYLIRATTGVFVWMFSVKYGDELKLDFLIFLKKSKVVLELAKVTTEVLLCGYWGVHMALFHCMVRHGTVRYGSLLGGFPLGTVPGTWYFFSTTSAEVPSDPYRYQNVTCKLYWSLIGQRESALLRHWTCDMRPIDPLDLNQHRQRRSGRSFCLNKRTFLH